MMKKLLVIAFAVLIALPAFSQVKFGIKAGAETTSTPTYDFTTGTSNNTTIAELKDAAWGFHGGLFARIKLGPIYLQPEVVFASNTFDYNVTENAIKEVKSQTFNRLSIPVLIGFKLGPIRINAGPAASIQIGTPAALIDDPNFTQMYRGAVWGYQAGLGIDLFKKLTFDARFAGSLGDMLGDSVTIGSGSGAQTFNLDYGQTSFLLSVGFMF
jgi:hypothetical protein